MNIQITYGSRYGSTMYYAKEFAALTGFPVQSYNKITNIRDCDRIIHFGALYAGGVLGLKEIASQLNPKAELIIVTVGLADVNDPANTNHIKGSIQKQISGCTIADTKIYHLRGAIDYDKLSLKHQAMMALLYAKARSLPESKKNAETKAMIDTYRKKVSFVSDAALRRLADTIASVP